MLERKGSHSAAKVPGYGSPLPPSLFHYRTHPLTSHRIDIAAHVPTACLGHLPSHALPLVRDRWEISRQILQIIMAGLCSAATQAQQKKTLCTRALFFSHAPWHLARHAPGTRVVILPQGKVGRLNVPQMNCDVASKSSFFFCLVLINSKFVHIIIVRCCVTHRMVGEGWR